MLQCSLEDSHQFFSINVSRKSQAHLRNLTCIHLMLSLLLKFYMVHEYFTMPFYPLFTKYLFHQRCNILSKFLLLELLSICQQYPHFLEIVTNVDSQTSPQTYWVRICIFKSPSPQVIYMHIKLWEALFRNIFWKNKENSSWLSCFDILTTPFLCLLTTLLSSLPGC